LLDLFADIQALLREDPYPEKVKAVFIIRSVEARIVSNSPDPDEGYSEPGDAGMRDLLE